MTILAELAALYARSPDLPRPGFSREAIGGEVVLAPDGSVAEMNMLATPDDKGKLRLRRMFVPTPPPDRRGMKIVPGTFWDPSPYAIGVAGKGGEVSLTSDRAPEKFAAFRQHHLELMHDLDVPALVAFRSFLESWEPSSFVTKGYPTELAGANLVFRLVGDRGFLHQAPLVSSDTEDMHTRLQTH